MESDMGWAEFEQSTRDYRNRKTAETAARSAIANENFRLEQKAKAQRWAEEENARINGILEKAGAQDTLQLIRDELWHEGQVEEFTQVLDKTVGGLRLVSEPYPSIKFKGNEENLVAHLAQERATIEAYVTPDVHAGFSGTSKLFIDSNNMYVVNDGRFRPSLEDQVKKYGLETGLRGITHNRRIRSRVELDPKSEDLEKEFNIGILSVIDILQQNNSFPGQIREWKNGIVDNLPRSLKLTGMATSDELRDWAHNIRGSSKIYRVSDRISRTVGLGGLKV